jgi:GntR family transcriptional regulator
MAKMIPTNSREVAAIIRQRVADETYPRGTELPTQDALSKELRVTQSTVSRALAVLTAEGLIQPVRGRRAIVTPIPPIVRNAAQRYSRAAREHGGAGGAAAAELAAMGLVSRNDLRVERVPTPPRVAEVFSTTLDIYRRTRPDQPLEASDPYTDESVIRARVMYAGDVITQLADSYIPIDIAGGTVLEQENEGTGGMVSRMAELGFAQVTMTERLRGRPADKDEAAALRITEGQQVFMLEHVGWTAEGRAVEVALHTMPQHLWIIDTEFPCD